MDKPRVLVVEDEPDLRELLEEMLAVSGFEVVAAATGTEALALVHHRVYDVALVDILMPGMDGLALLGELKRHDAALEVVMMTGNPQVDTAVQALKAGAFDYLVKPLNFDEVLHLMGRIAEKRFLSREVGRLRRRLGEQLTGRELVGNSPELDRVRELVATVAGSDSPVLIEGESGTGKELVAAAIHRQSSRAEGPFVPVNCSAIPSELLESEFFGHVRGAFSGAVADTLGLFRSADGGTLFLDEVAELPITLQAKLLRVLEEKEIRPVGSTRTHAVDVRIIAATNQTLEARVKRGAFRQDLFYRLNVVRITLAPLRERKADIPALVTRFIRQFNERFRREIKGVAPDALAALMAYQFPGNVRELENLVERAFALGARDQITRNYLPALAPAPAAPTDLPSGRLLTVEEAERGLIAEALRRFGTDREAAARALGMTVRTFYRRLKKYNLK